MSEARIQRRLAAILAADVVGYSRLMERDEAGTLSDAEGAAEGRVRAPRSPAIDGPHRQGDRRRLLVEFGSVVNAVECAVDLQQAMAAANDGAAEDAADGAPDRHQSRRRDHRGRATSTATASTSRRGSRALAEPGGVAISDSVHEHVRGRVALDFVDRGEHEVKNIERPVHVWAGRPA